MASGYGTNMRCPACGLGIRRQHMKSVYDIDARDFKIPVNVEKVSLELIIRPKRSNMKIIAIYFDFGSSSGNEYRSERSLLKKKAHG